MKQFHITLQARGAAQLAPGTPFASGGRSFPTLDPAAARQPHPFPLSFEAAAERLSSWERMFLEPDGAFVWRGASGECGSWQLDGVLFDRGGQLQFVELKGSCPEAEFERFSALLCSGDAAQELTVQLMEQAVFLTEHEFRRWAFPAAGIEG